MNDQHERNEQEREPGVDQSAALAYSNLLFANIVDWYKNADSKAQIILTLDGALIAFLTTSIFRKPGELSEITRYLTLRTWLLLIAMCVCLVGSVVSALLCLWSRVFLGIRQDSILGQEKKRITEGATPYSPNVMLFFKTICWLDHNTFQKQLETTDASFHIRALGSQAYLLSKRVYRKHVLVNAGFVLAGAGLILFLASGVSYLAHLR